MNSTRAFRSLVFGGLLGLGLVAAPCVALAGPPPGMPDPSQMSGIPRPDPNLAPGKVTVRCLDGGFANPAIGVTVTLDLKAPDGTTTTVEAMSVEQGRASFSIGDHIGSSVTASATIGDQTLRSQTFTITAQSGVALLLVRSGAGAPGGASPDAGAGGGHGGQGAVPLPGKPFPLTGRPAGELIVGALDLGRDTEGQRQGELGPIANIEVSLRATAEGEEGEGTVLTGITDSEGRVTFEGLAEKFPAGTTIVVEATLEEGAEVTRSQELVVGTPGFDLAAGAYAVVLTKGVMPQTAPAQQGPAQQGPAGQGGPPPAAAPRMQLPGPRVDKQLERGQVRVLLLDSNDQPVVDQKVQIHSSQTSGESEDQWGTTDARGEAIVEDVAVGPDMLAQLRVVYDGAPYNSTLFEMPERNGAVVPLRVYRATSDRQLVRSALQIDVTPRENDFAAVTLMYAVFVDGDEAFWVPGGMRLYAPAGARSVHVLPESEDWLFHDGEAPWVDIDRPLLPGQELRLSFAVGMAHDGSLELDWSAPFPLVEDASVVSVPAELDVTHGVAGAPEINPHAARDGGPLELYRLGHDRFQLRICDFLAEAGRACSVGTWAGADMSVVIEGLPVRSRVWPYTAWFLLGLSALGIGLGISLRPRKGAREALLERRDALMAALVAMDGDEGKSAPKGRERARMLETLDRIYRQLEALGDAKDD